MTTTNTNDKMAAVTTTNATANNKEDSDDNGNINNNYSTTANAKDQDNNNNIDENASNNKDSDNNDSNCDATTTPMIMDDVNLLKSNNQLAMTEAASHMPCLDLACVQGCSISHSHKVPLHLWFLQLYSDLNDNGKGKNMVIVVIWMECWLEL